MKTVCSAHARKGKDMKESQADLNQRAIDKESVLTRAKKIKLNFAKTDNLRAQIQAAPDIASLIAIDIRSS